MQSKKVLIRIVNKADSYLADNVGGYDDLGKYAKEELGSEQADEIAANFNGDCFLGLGFDREEEAPAILETDGELIEEDGRITLKYSSMLTGPFGSEVLYSFEPDKRHALTVTRRSIFEESYFFDGRTRRQVVVYEDGRSKLELSLYTKSLKNQMTFENGGFIEIEYYAEIRGGVVEHCREYVFCEPRE